MKSTMTFFFLIIGATLLMNGANAESPQELIKLMTEQIHKNPDDKALREKIIKFAMNMNTPLPVSDDALQHLELGNKMFFEAKNDEDYRQAEHEFKTSAMIAPWWTDPYCQLGEAQSKVRERLAAISSFELCILGIPPGAMQERNQARLDMEKMLQQRDEELCGRNDGLIIKCGAGQW